MCVGGVGLIIRVVGLLLFATSIALNVILWSKQSVHVVLSQELDTGGGPKRRQQQKREREQPPQKASAEYTRSDQKASDGDVILQSIASSTRPTVDIGIGGSDITKAGRNVTTSDWRLAYEISLQRFHNRTATAATFATATNLRQLLGLREAHDRFETSKTPVIELLRVPKSASTHLSITGRVLAGCRDPGYPCCIKKHDGAMCPKEGLFCGWVKNCVGHGSLKDPTSKLAKITQLRNPAERLLSGFFYSESVHNKRHKGCITWQCFKEYLSDLRVRNAPITKQLLGRYMYHGSEVQPGEVEIAKQNLCRLSWFGMLDMPLASKLLLYELEPFDHLQPHPVVFDLPPEDGSIVIETHHIRKNINSTYEEFVKGDYVAKRGLELIVSLNEYEFDLYAFAWGLFCARIWESGLLQYSERFESAHHFDECLKSKYNVPAIDYCPRDEQMSNNASQIMLEQQKVTLI